MNFAVLLAGGTGVRMKGARLPKQFLELGGEPLVRIVTDKFLICPGIDRVAVAVPDVWMSHTRDILSDERFADVLICTGGATRQESLYLAVKQIDELFPLSDQDGIVSHDVARPFVTLRIIEDNLAALSRYEVVDTVLPATDTIVESLDGEFVSRIPDRSAMYQGQTPQSFRGKTFLELYERLGEERLGALTDAARIFVEQGLRVGLVRGESYNIKLTTSYDYHIATFLLELRHD